MAHDGDVIPRGYGADSHFFVRGKLAILGRSWLASEMENRRAESKADRRPRQRSIQGEGRPFGIATGSQAALIHYADITRLLAGLNLALDVEALLAKRLRSVMADYIGALVRAERKASYAEALKLLAAIAMQSRKLERDLQQLENDFLVLIDEQREAIAGAEQVRHFNFLHLVPAFGHLGQAAEQVARRLKPKREGAPRKERLDSTAGALASIVKEFGLPVVLRQSGSAAGSRKGVGGVGGDVPIPDDEGREADGFRSQGGRILDLCFPRVGSR